MAPIKGEKTALQRLVEESNKRSQDFDPEDIGNGPASSDNESDVSQQGEDDATAHYENVGKSKLREAQSAELGSQYAGSTVSRTALNQSDDEDELDEDDDEDGNGAQLDGMSDEDGSLDGPGDNMEEDSEGFGDSADESLDEDDEDQDLPLGSKTSGDTAALAAIAQQGQETAVQNLAQAAQADVEKGNAVKKQRSTFNSLLNSRMRLQKGLVAANTLSSLPSAEISSDSDRVVIESAEKAALSLFNSISALRSSIPSTEIRGTKRPFSATIETSTPEIHKHMQDLESSSAPSRKAILTRWAQKTQPSAALTSTSKLRGAPVQQSFVDMLDAQLMSSSLARLVSRSRIPRSCAPVQAGKSKTEDPAIYDDADWYALLLRDLVESKMGDSGADAGDRGINGAMPTAASVDALRRQAKTHRANVDVKASKGRKLRFTVQEKIQNFMAPEDRTTWNDRQITELFGSLLGKRIAGGLGEAEEEEDEEASINGHGIQAEPLRLFAK